MSIATTIECVDVTWNPITGCDEISLGCLNCYAKKMSKRLFMMNQPKYANNFKLTLHEYELNKPYSWKKHRVILVNSMSDIFHEKVPLDFLLSIFHTMNNTSHTYLLLTKRIERIIELDSLLPWSRNIWIGVTIEHNKFIQRAEILKQSRAYHKFITFEPLLSDIDVFETNGIDWIIAGGESGHNSRLMEESWIRNIRDICILNNVPFFFKQWSGNGKKKVGRILDGKYWNEIPKFN
ncbi:MAG: phage Gp37/Gp68 family protein [Desulfuromonadales bacterium]|nr:phage Gp37/Gp68 family protein [Desulfuromonadales bacterium]